MGQQAINNIPITPEWKETDQEQGHRMYIHSVTNEIGREYVIALDGSLKIEQELTIYNYRKNQKLNLVRVHGVQLNSNPVVCCGTAEQIRVIVEHFPNRLTDVEPYTFPQALYIFNEVRAACNAIVTKLGAVLFEDSMFGVTKEGHVRVWVNSNFQMNHPSKFQKLKKSPKENEREMVLSLIRVVESHVVGGKFPIEFITPIESFLSLNFVSFQGYIDKYADANRVIIPCRLGINPWERELVAGGGEVMVEETYPLRPSESIFISDPNNPSPPSIFPYNNISSIPTQISPIGNSGQLPYSLYPIQALTTKVESYQHRQFQSQTPSQFPPLQTNPLPSSLFPRYEIPPSQMIHTSSIVKKQEMGSLITADRTMSYRDNPSYISHNVESYGSMISHGAIHPVSSVLVQQPQSQTTFHQVFERLDVNQIHTSPGIMLPSLPPNQSIQPREPFLPLASRPPYQPQPLTTQALPPRISLPSPISYPPQPLSRPNPLSLPIPSQQNYITPIKQIERQQDLYMTTTTYKNHPKFTFQYRTIHPESVQLIADHSQASEITRVKLPTPIPNPNSLTTST